MRSVNGMTHSLNTYTQKMSLKKKQISQEKRKTELLLYQMLPRHVAGTALFTSGVVLVVFIKIIYLFCWL